LLPEKKIGASQKLPPPLPQVKSEIVHVMYTLSLNGLPGHASAAISSLSSNRFGLPKFVRTGTAVALSGGSNGLRPPEPGVCRAEPLKHEFAFHTKTPSKPSCAKSA